MTRARSEYRLSPITVARFETELITRPASASDRHEMARLMLDAYAGTIDDEGEDIDDALNAIDHYLRIILSEHSFVVIKDQEIVGMAFTVVVNDVHYVDPIVIASSQKRSGLGRTAVQLILTSLSATGIDEVGATITDGNEASEQLFKGLGFTRQGAWGEK